MDGWDSVELTVAKDRSVQSDGQSDGLADLRQMALAMAHDINNTLSIVLGRSQLALEENIDARVRKHLQTIEEAVLDATARVRQFQDSATLALNRTSEEPVVREEPGGGPCWESV